uniref:Poly [ADP-ribose] polymerase n=1 Tax=Denticeps clupeoides TaxID=299321 RepID=A0AAY4D1M5_9TELE
MKMPHRCRDLELRIKPYFDFLLPDTSNLLVSCPSGAADPVPMETEEMPASVSTLPSTMTALTVSGNAAISETPASPAHLNDEVTYTARAKEKVQSPAASAKPAFSHIDVPDPLKLHLFEASRLPEKLRSENPDFDLHVTVDGVKVVGPDQLGVERVKNSILEFLSSIAQAHLTFDKMFSEFLAKEEVKQKILEELKEQNLPSNYEVSGPVVVVTSLSLSMVHQACNSIKALISQFSLPVEETYECMLYCQEWPAFLCTLDFCSVFITDIGRKITVVTMKDMEEEKQTAIIQFLTTPVQKDTVILMEPGMLNYLQIFYSHLLAEMNQVTLLPLESGDGLSISGNAGACQTAEEVLHGLIDAVCTKTIRVCRPGIARFLVGEEGTSILHEMQSKFQVHISMDQVHWETTNEVGIFFSLLILHSNSTNDIHSFVFVFRIFLKARGKLCRIRTSQGLSALPATNTSNLEEDARLSLAIQYSMETNVSTGPELSRENSLLNQAVEASLKDCIRMANVVEISVFAGYSTDLIRVDIALGKKVTQRQCEEQVSHKNLKNLSEYYKRCLDLIMRKHAVEIRVDGTTVTVSGFKDYVAEALPDVKNLLKRISNTVSDPEVLTSVQWVRNEQGTMAATPYLPEATTYIENSSDEFQDVVKEFYDTIEEYHNKIRIIKVEKITNSLLYNQYKLKKASMLANPTSVGVERTLFHGTNERSVKEICVHGFNRSFCGKNATVYGQGVYFAVNAGLSVSDTYSPPNADGHKFVFMVKVLTGDYTVGQHEMKAAPLKEDSAIPLRFDSVTDSMSRPTLFVIFNDTQAYPEYLITCQKIYR